MLVYSRDTIRVFCASARRGSACKDKTVHLIRFSSSDVYLLNVSSARGETGGGCCDLQALQMSVSNDITHGTVY